MGVDIETYRGRIGRFRHSQGLDVVTIVCTINFHRGMRAIGTVVFIGVLLLIAGIESNPGPTTLGSCTCSSRPKKIKVTGLPENIDEEDLNNLFENKRRQGGGDVRHVQVFESQRTAIIEFEESEAVEIVLKKRPISIKKTEVSVHNFHSSNTVEVTNIPTDVSVESLKKYFEEQASDEDSITCIVKEADVAFVTFKNEKITKQIVYKDRHTVENHRQPVVVNFHDPELVHTDEMNVTGSSDLNIGNAKPTAYKELQIHENGQKRIVRFGSKGQSK
ncbi:uncharacterized protein LOC128554541 [Mercenaria mercenaria]|uniref:uncharacterized protein LOC128554541 n=1 Tax=Mercenaria mercenaria TaxID=6596 RepID=UPI00234E621F|nr:uncharacterized protein LOC128554541 [Mercenaria mercenaria]